LLNQGRDEGWQFQVKGVFEGAFNPSGGDREAAAGAGEADFKALADLGTLIGDQGGSLEAAITDRFGAKLDDAAGLHTLMQTQEIWGRGDIWRLTQLSFAQDLFDKKATIELGRMNPGADFDVLPCNFQNLTFCGAVGGNIDGDYWMNWPVSQWGARAQLQPSDSFSAGAGVYQINPRNIARGFSLDFSGGQGELIPYQVEWKPKLFALPGDYQLGGWYATMRADDIFLDADGAPAAVSGVAPLMDHGRKGFFITGRQQVTGDAPAADAPAGADGRV
jgi:porin